MARLLPAALPAESVARPLRLVRHVPSVAAPVPVPSAQRVPAARSGLPQPVWSVRRPVSSV